MILNVRDIACPLGEVVLKLNSAVGEILKNAAHCTAQDRRAKCMRVAINKDVDKDKKKYLVFIPYECGVWGDIGPAKTKVGECQMLQCYGLASARARYNH